MSSEGLFQSTRDGELTATRHRTECAAHGSGEIDHEVPLRLVRRQLSDLQVLKLLGNSLHAGAMDEGGGWFQLALRRLSPMNSLCESPRACSADALAPIGATPSAWLWRSAWTVGTLALVPTRRPRAGASS